MAVTKMIKTIGKKVLPNVSGGTVNDAIKVIPEIAGQYVANAKCDIIRKLNVGILKSLKGALGFKMMLQAQSTHQRKDPEAKGRQTIPVVLLRTLSGTA